MIGNLESRVSNLLAALGLNPPTPGDAPDRDLEGYLGILLDVPQPSLAQSRARVLAEAARMQSLPVPARFMSGRSEHHLALGVSAWAGVALAAVLFVVSIWFAHPTSWGNSVFGFWGDATMASAKPASTQTASIQTEGPAATMNPTPGQRQIAPSVMPAATPQPAIAPMPDRGPSLTLTRAAPLATVP